MYQWIWVDGPRACDGAWRIKKISFLRGAKLNIIWGKSSCFCLVYGNVTLIRSYYSFRIILIFEWSCLPINHGYTYNWTVVLNLCFSFFIFFFYNPNFTQTTNFMSNKLSYKLWAQLLHIILTLNGVRF